MTDQAWPAGTEPLREWGAVPAMEGLCRAVSAVREVDVGGVPPAGRAFLAAWLARRFPERPLVVVTEGVKAQERIQQDLETWLGWFERGEELQTGPEARGTQGGASGVGAKELRVWFYPAWEVLPHQPALPNVDVISERMETLVRLALESKAPAKRPPVVVASVTALMQRTFPRAGLQARLRVLRRGEKVDPLDLIEWLEEQGYEPEAQVTQKGEIASRGGILDLYPPVSPWPVRLEFFGNELEELRYFDPVTQVSREKTEWVAVPPAGEIDILRSGAATSRKRGRAVGPGEPLGTLLDYLSREAVFVLCEPERLTEQAERYAEQIPDGDRFFISWAEFLETARGQGKAIVQVRETTAAEDLLAADLSEPDKATGADEPGDNEAQAPPVPVSPRLDFEMRGLEAFQPLLRRMPGAELSGIERKEFFGQLHRWLRQGYEVFVFCNNEGERQRFEEVWTDYGLDRPQQGRKTGPEAWRPHLVLGTLAQGLVWEEGKFVVATDAEVFGRYKVQRPRRLKAVQAAAAQSVFDIQFTDLEEGDYVVHLQHGVGRFLGLQVVSGPRDRSAAGVYVTEAPRGEECLVIEYAANQPDQPPPRLFVPVTQAHLVGKYVGAGKARPPLNTLGGQRWAKTKARAENAVRDLAGELLGIQAARESQPGIPCSTDSPWQREFEGAFLYEETPDQLTAIEATKRDQEMAKPMDRLICGDVGFGKTEVAIRAAFKTVMGGRQVAVMVPTTVLAQQHYNVFRERMADYPVRIELLSRFRSKKQQQAVVADLAKGTVEIVIGTHRLVQEDVRFKDLGLVVVDEEQRFGVMQKERFKRFRRMVDVLTLSATPIPRTLYMALTGVRDMSTIESPPQDRLPVETIVAAYDERLIREAIQREINREGQVFFLHNRVGTINLIALKLRSLLPDARILVGHGQMPADELEEVMTRFVNGEADVLLSTTIIESGLDIPNANTIIIDRADRFGLSDLYQLRGRVGRYKHQAYAYLLLPRHAGLLTNARKRITAMKQYSALGSGFRIAMRDLEIRGAGNLLGPEQSGHITAVGFELYCQLLKQSVSSLKGEPIKLRIDVAVRLDFLSSNPAAPAEEASEQPLPVEEDDLPWLGQPEEKRLPSGSAFIPFTYVSEPKQRIDLYRKLAQADSAAALAALREEMRDRFGPIPAAVDLLLRVGELKILAAQSGVTAVETRGDKLIVTRAGDYLMKGTRFPRLTKADPRARLNEIKRMLLHLPTARPARPGHG